ncbi:MAG: DUF814 domain-containing protein [Bdellovibrionaceae bacterium]|nr:DUF814 domain-containing protein [Pseudobdellovibrionaceae bacterium]
MKSYSQPELRTFVSERLIPLEGARLQEVLVNDRGMALGFWRQGLSWLILDLNPNDPIALLYEGECPFSKAAKSKPAALFLKSHGVDKALSEVRILEDYGRVLQLTLANSEAECVLEIHLVPKQANLLVQAAGKKIAWEKPKELAIREPLTEFPPERSLALIHEQWKNPAAVTNPGLDPETQWRKKRDRDLEKKRKALDELEKQLASDESSLWYARGEALKNGAGELIDPQESRAWNIEEAFGKAKKLEAKKTGIRDRLSWVRKEVEQLEQETFESARQKNTNRKTGGPASPALMAQSKARGRTFHLDEGVSAFLGKSAADNMALLRKAKAWDYWLHLRDEPGAHAIVQRPKQRILSDEELRAIAKWLIKESMGKRLPLSGEKVPVVVTECRHVRPIKGDKLGRVTYHEARQFDVRWD